MQIRLNFSDDMSKEQEIGILSRLMETCDKYPNNYISSLFTNDFIFWVSQRIKNDFPINVMEYIDYDPESDLEVLKKIVSEKDVTIARLSDADQIRQKIIDKQIEEIKDLKDREHDISNDLEIKTQQSQHLLMQLKEREDIIVKKDEKLRNLLRKYGDISRDTGSTVEDLREENVNLKARLFDMMEKKKLEDIKS